MARLHVIAPGARTTVQDLGFRNARSQGVPAGGVLDRDTLFLVNALLDNPPGTEALELALTGCRMRAEAGPVRVALDGILTGRVIAPDGSSRELAPWTATTLADGAELVLDPPRRGGTGLLGIGGGLDLPVLLESRSTSLRAGFGGVGGRALIAGDQLELRGPEMNVAAADRVIRRSPPPDDGSPIRVVPGPQADWFDDEATARLFCTPYRVSAQTDRMGMRLDGPPLTFAAGKGADIISDGIAPGAIQVPGNGLPIILLADAQTTGGYAKIATVIRADLPRLAARLPGDEIRLTPVTLLEAEALARERHAQLAAAAASIAEVTTTSLDLRALYAVNLMSGMVDAGRPDHFDGHLFAQGDTGCA